jgi:hypothetical protein
MSVSDSTFLDSTGKPVTRMPEVVRPGASAIILNDHGEVLLERISDESTDIGYFNVAALPESCLLSHLVFIRDAVANLPTPVIR